MSIVFERIHSIEDFDYDAMFQASEIHLDENFFAKVPYPLTYEEKKQYYKDQLQSAFDGKSYLQRENEQLFLFLGVFDGIPMEFGGGYIENDGETLRFHWYLTAPDTNGSRNILHLDSTADIRKVFYNAHGITKYRVETYVDSPLHKWMKLRAASGHRVILSETTTVISDTLTEVSVLMEV